MDLWQSLSGRIEVEFTGAELEESFRIINRENIPVFHVQSFGELTASFIIRRQDFRRLKELCQKRGDTLRIKANRGIYWTLRGLVRRPVLIGGLLIYLFTLFFLPSRVLFIRVEGNTQLPQRQILAAAEESGILFGASRRQVRSEKVKNDLLAQLPQLKWAGVNTYGCVAVISVRERAEEPEQKETHTVSSIVAVRDGIVTSCTATRGTLLCTPGDLVRQGQTLISGYTDCGLCIQASNAEGEVYAATSRELAALTPATKQNRVWIQDTSRKISLLFGKKRINLWKGSGIWDGSCGRMYEEYYITLPGGFRLPFGLSVETVISYEVTEASVPEELAEENLSSFACNYVTEQMMAGRILSQETRFYAADGVYCFMADYRCQEMIGRVKQEQIGEQNG